MMLLLIVGVAKYTKTPPPIYRELGVEVPCLQSEAAQRGTRCFARIKRHYRMNASPVNDSDAGTLRTLHRNCLAHEIDVFCVCTRSDKHGVSVIGRINPCLNCGLSGRNINYRRLRREVYN